MPFPLSIDRSIVPVVVIATLTSRKCMDMEILQFFPPSYDSSSIPRKSYRRRRIATISRIALLLRDLRLKGCFNMITTGNTATTTVSLRPNIKAGHSCAKHYSSFKHFHNCLSLPARSPKFRNYSATLRALRDGDDAFEVPLMAVNGKRTRSRAISCKASKIFPTLFTYPPMASKPKWWWRSFACTPYLLPLHLMWFHADSAYRLHPLMENWEFLVNPFLDTISLMPNWIMMSLMFAAYYLVVRRKEWPHFLRFHVVMAMLLENGYQALAIACGWLPKTLYRGNLGVTFWLAVAVAQLFTVVECMRAALSGKYADVPLASDAAYIHSDLNLF